MIKLISSYREDIANVVLEKTFGNVKYTSPQIQKEILSLLSFRMQCVICEEIGDAKYCIIVYEACNKFKKEQMAIVITFVNKDGCICEYFFMSSMYQILILQL